MIPYLIAGSVIGLVYLVKKGVDYLEEADIRRRQHAIRAAKNNYLNVREENEKLAKSIRRARRENEYERRGALIAYHKRRREMLELVISDISEAKQAGYDHVRAIQENLSRLPGWSSIGAEGKSLYRSSKDQVHAYIGRLKSLEEIAQQERNKSKARLDSLHDKTTHGRLGAKKAIKEHLDEMVFKAKEIYCHRSASGIYLPFQETTLVLECRCMNPTCKAFISPEMQFCMVCGKDQKQGIEISANKSSEEGIACSCCEVRIDETLPFCFNCGEKNDPFGLLAAYDA